MNIGDRVKWKLDPADLHPSGWGIVRDFKADDDGLHAIVEVHSFPSWLGALDGKFHPLIRCAVPWLIPF